MHVFPPNPAVVLQDEPGIKGRVVVAMSLLAAAKCLNVTVPFMFKYAVDHLNAHLPATSAGEAFFNMSSAPDVVFTSASTLLLGC